MLAFDKRVPLTGSTAAGSVRIGPAGMTLSLDTVAFGAAQTRANNAAESSQRGPPSEGSAPHPNP